MGGWADVGSKDFPAMHQLQPQLLLQIPPAFKVIQICQIFGLAHTPEGKVADVDTGDVDCNECKTDVNKAMCLCVHILRCPDQNGTFDKWTSWPLDFPPFPKLKPQF